MKELKRQLKKIKNTKGLVNPDCLWVVANKTKMLNQISNTNVRQEKRIESFENNLGILMKIERNIETYIPKNFRYSIKPVLAVFLALFFTSGGWIASAYAEPGDMFWSTKMAFNSVLERSQIAFAASDEETELHLKFATKKADVIKQVSEKTEVKVEDKNKMIKDTKEKMKKDLDSASESIKNISSEKASEMVKEVSLKTTEIAKSVQESAENVAGSDQQLAKDLGEAANETQKTSLEMVEIVLQKKAESNKEITAEEKTIITEHITNIVSDLEVKIAILDDEEKKAEQELANTSSTIVSEIKNNLSTSTSVSSTVINIAGSTQSSSTAINISNSTLNIEKTIEVKNILDQTKIELEKSKGEVTVLMQADVLGAIQKTKEITITTKEAQTQIANIISKVEVIPVVTVDQKVLPIVNSSTVNLVNSN